MNVSVTLTGQGSVTSSPSGIACSPTCSQSFASGSVVTLTPVAATGYAFNGWSGGCTGTGSCTVGGNGTVRAAATFVAVAAPPPPPPSPSTYTLTVSKSGPG